ncbi:MAG: helix-turn-helix domain-containing protein [Nitritalea sp.]
MKEEHIRIIFGLKIKQLRKDKHLSLQELSEKSGISISYLNEIEKSKKYPKADKIFKLAESLNVSYDYLVSLQLDDKMKTISDLLQSDILSELPLDIFGIDVATFIELLSDAPSKLNAFIITLMDISRAYDISKEEFFLSALRAYQEMHDNYFPDLEQAAEKLKKQFHLEKPSVQRLQEILETAYQYRIDAYDFDEDPELKGLRSLVLPGKSPRLLFNRNLTENQKLFTLGRELGHCFLSLENRPLSYSWVSVHSFEEVLNHFKASYFSCALLIPEKGFVKDLEHFLHHPTLEASRLLQLIEKYTVTPETLIYRLTNVLPRHFGLKELFFLRISKNTETKNFSLNKELHLTGIHHPHASKGQEDYCRRWVSATIFDDFERSGEKVVGKGQFSFYPDGDSYFVFAIAYRAGMNAKEHVSISFGLKANALFKRKVKFHNDQNIPLRYVGTTCQRCPVENCEVRVAAPKFLLEAQRKEAKRQAMERLKKQIL